MHRVLLDPSSKPTLLLFSALSNPQFRTIKLRSKKLSCPACGQEGQKISSINEIDYVQFCGGEKPDWEKLGMAEGDGGEERIRVNVCLPHHMGFAYLTQLNF